MEHNFYAYLTYDKHSGVFCVRGAVTRQLYQFAMSQPTLRVDNRDVPGLLSTGRVVAH